MNIRKIRHILIVAVVFLSVAPALSQTSTQYDRATPPQHTAGVSAVGSYVSADLGTVNLSNGALNFKIPIGTIGGRGVSMPITLNYSSKVWSASMDTEENQQGTEVPVAYADYDRGSDWVSWWDFIGAGWTVGGVPMLTTRRVQIEKITGGPCNGGYSYLLTKLSLKLPDGGEVEFRDDLYDGAPLPASSCGASAASRGTRWHATDGSGMIFINDVDNGVAAFPMWNLSGVVVTRDGTRYRFGGGGLCTSITDRNGNKITIEYFTPAEVRYTDQLGRVTTIKQNVADPHNPSVTLAILVTFPGYQGAPRYFKIKRGVMNANYRSDINPSLPVITGDWDPLSRGYGWPAGTTKLFVKSYGRFAYQIDDLNVLTELVLPDARSLSFRYNQFGEVAEVILPVGGKVQYDFSYKSELPSGNSPSWQTGTNGTGGGILSDVRTVDRAVVERRTYPDGVNLEGKWNYSYGPQLVSGVNHRCTQVQARSTSNALLLDERHFFLSAMQYTEPPNGGNHDGTHYALWSTSVEWRTEARDASGNVLSVSEQDWTQRSAVSWPTYQQEQPAKDNRVNQVRRYLDNGMMAKTETSYDEYNNPTEVREYGFDQLLKRRTTTTYLTWNNSVNYATDDSIHLPSLPVATTIFNAAGTQVAQSVNEYDVYASDGNRALLTDYGAVSQHDPNYGITKTTRGNVTRVGQWLNTSGTFIYSYPRFDTLGNVVGLKDPNGNLSTVSFTDDFGPGQNPGSPSQNPTTATYALPTLVTSPPPLPGAPVHTARSQYDYSTGLLTGFRDRNNIVTQTFYSDPFNRPTQVRSALGVVGVESHTTNYYAPATVFGLTLARNDVLTVTDLNAIDDASIRAWSVTDGFGRTIEEWKRDPQGDVKVATIYDCLHRVKQQSNPFRPATEGAVYTTTAYDFLGRVISLTTPDGAVVSTAYSGNTVTVTDQAGKARRSVTDAHGRLIEVYEDPSGFNYLTTYTYDALDNLVKVMQGSQQRFFMYDSLKRLLRARNPEQETWEALNFSDPLTGNNAWSTGYQYDANSNITLKTDARGVVSTYTYDAFNRNTTVNYSDTSLTPDVKRFYDGATNGKGRFWYHDAGGDFSNGSDVEHTAIDSYDEMGRPLEQRQLFKHNWTWSAPYQTSRTYNRGGRITSQTYPSGHWVTYNYDSAGRVADKDASNLAFTGNLGDGAQRTYSSGITYSPWGSLSIERFGTQTPLYHKLQYNVRGQLWDVRVATGSDVNGSWNRGALQFFYDSTYGFGTSGPDNNGNVLKSKHYVPLDESSSTWAIHDQIYTYDSINRLASATEYFVSSTQSQTQTSLQSYIYDRWGNRTINPSSWGTGINTKPFTVDIVTNRLGVPNGQPGVMTYDNAGNLLTDTYTGAGARTYDAENRMTTAADNTGQTSRYTYNADGQRTRRQIAGSQEEWQIYGFDGELLAEYRAGSPASSAEKEYGYRNGQLLITATGRFNVALAANGAVATASSAHTCCGFSTAGAINGNNRGPWGNGEGWNDATQNVLPDWIQVEFAGNKTIDEISVFSLHDNYTQANTPTETQTFSLYGLFAFDVQYWNGSSWITIFGASVTGNNKVWRKFTFSPITTNKIRVFISSVPDVWSRVVEIQAFGTSAGGEKVQWLVPDHLGTPRIIIDETGSRANVKRHDYLPFGEELFAGSGGRTPGLGYAADGVRQQFTSKERDTETGLDYFGARYYASIQGRFTSFDPKAIGLNQRINPQRWNRYAYALNSPLGIYDPDGQDPIGQGGAIVIDIYISHDPKLKGDDNLTKSQQAKLDGLIATGAKKGIDIRLHDGFNATAEDADRSLADKGNVVMFAGHTSRHGNADGTQGPYLGFDSDSGTLGTAGIIYTDQNKKYFQNPRTPGGEPALVVALACDSAQLRSVARGAENYIGAAGQPSTYGQYNGIIAAVNTIVTSGKVDAEAVRAAAERAIQKNPQQGNPDKNTKLVLNPAPLPPNSVEMKIPVRRAQ